MESERIFSIFIYFNDGVATEYGLRHHRSAGSDEVKLRIIEEALNTDLENAKRFPLNRNFTIDEWRAKQRIGIDLKIFEDGLKSFRASNSPYLVITMVCDGVAKVDIKHNLEPFQGSFIDHGHGAIMRDWLVEYAENDVIRIDKLIDDDYYKAIRILFKYKYLVSAAKLLMSCIDTLAFVEFGDMPKNFSQWVDKFVQLDEVGITSNELWEFRNSIMHMTNLSSRAVNAGKVLPIMPYIGSDQLASNISTATPRPFNLHKLLNEVSTGIENWGHSLNKDRDKFMKFVERYDLIISDARLATITDNQSPAYD